MGRKNYGNKRHNRNFNKNNDNDEISDVIDNIKNLSMLSDMSVKDFADEGGYADIVANNSGNLNTNQLRKFFGAVRLMEKKDDLTWEKIEPDFYILKPRLAVSAGRGNISKSFYNLMMATMKKVDVGNEEDKIKNFKIFVQFFESIVAYHKFYGSKKGKY